MKTSSWPIAAVLTLLLAAMALKGELVRVPPVREIPAAGAFDTGRAIGRLERILGDQRPHPVDTGSNDAVRGRLIAELRGLGVDPQVTDQVACNSNKRSKVVSCARVRNVHATIGEREGPHLLLSAHYDSSTVGPGAADDGIGVAVMLETAAHLVRGPPTRPVTLLFTDGEESGLLGARAFLDHDALASRVDSLINVEARGVNGPAVMFETSSPNGAVLTHFARSVPIPSANSLNSDFAKLIPNSTDVEVFKAKDWAILNFAIIGNETRYHSAGDTLAALDRRSVQHMGDQVLAASKDMAGGRTEASGTKVYADLLGRTFIVLPLNAALAALGLLSLAFLLLAWRRRPGMAVAVGTILTAIAGSGAGAFVAQSIIGIFRSGEYWRGFPAMISFATSATALLASVAMLAWLGRKAGSDRLRIAFWLVFLLLGIALALIAPGGSIFFLLPSLVALAGTALERRLPGAERAGSLAGAVLLFLTWAPLLHLSEMLLDHGAASVFAPVAALIVLPFLVELRSRLAAVPLKPSLIGLGAAFVFAWIATALIPAYSEDRKQAFGIDYVWDHDKKQAQWLIANDGLELPAGFAGFKKDQKVPYSIRKRWAAPGPSLPQESVPDVGVRKLEDRTTSKGRVVTLRIEAHGADSVTLHAPPDASLLAASMSGSTRTFGKGAPKDPYYLRCHGRSCDGQTVRILIRGNKPVQLIVLGTRFGLPAAAGALVKARPSHAAPQYAPDSTIGFRRARI
ncbi:MAG: M20/M25/M40 family metallo-hydrolase [Sphingosinicella sp.]|nr:M20/M25/M40 family metallo-hydrolase [Sphingosinicella sp.]